MSMIVAKHGIKDRIRYNNKTYILYSVYNSKDKAKRVAKALRSDLFYRIESKDSKYYLYVTTWF